MEGLRTLIGASPPLGLHADGLGIQQKQSGVKPITTSRLLFGPRQFCLPHNFEKPIFLSDVVIISIVIESWRRGTRLSVQGFSSESLEVSLLSLNTCNICPVLRYLLIRRQMESFE